MIEALFNILIKIVGTVISVVIWLVKTLFANIFLRITISFFKLLDFVQDLFRKLAGLGTIYDKAGNAMGTAGVTGTDSSTYNAGGDLVIYLFKQKVIQNALFGMIILAVVLLFIATFIQMARVEFTEDGAKNSKWPILASALKSLAMFFIVPITCVFGVLLSNFVLKMVDGVTAGGNSVTVSGLIFKLGAYDANVVPRSSEEASEEYVNKSLEWLQEELGSGSSNSTQAKIENGKLNEEASKLLGISGSLTYNDLADAIDDRFASRKYRTNGQITFEYAFDDVAKIGEGEEISYLNYFLVMHFYYQTKMNFLYMWIAIFVALSSLFNASLGMIMRLYNLAVLFIISPPIAALMPLDGGSAYKNWRQKFIGSTISAYGTIAGLNLFFQIVPIVQSINLFDPSPDKINKDLSNINNGFYNRLTQILFVLVGCLMIKDISKMISGIIGAEDVMEAGAGMSKQIAEKAAKVGKVAVAGAALATGVGAAAFAKFSAGKAQAEGGVDESIIKDKKANREEMTGGQKLRSKIRSFSVMDKIGAKFGKGGGGGAGADSGASEGASQSGGKGNKKNLSVKSGKSLTGAKLVKAGSADQSAVSEGAPGDQSAAQTDGGDDGAKVTPGSTSAPSGKDQKAQLASVNKWTKRAARARRASQRGMMLAGNLATSMIAGSGVGKALNEMTGGAFKALGGKGTEQWDGAIAGKSDLDEGTIAMLKKEKKNARQIAAEDRMGDAYYAAITSYNERMVSDHVFSGESKKFTADVAGQNINNLVEAFNKAQNKQDSGQVTKILEELVETLKTVGFKEAHLSADNINAAVGENGKVDFDKFNDGDFLKNLLSGENKGVNVTNGEISLKGDNGIKVEADEFIRKIQQVFNDMKLQVKMTDRKASYDGLVKAITSGLSNEQKKAAGISGFQEVMGHWQGSSSTEKRDRGDLKAILSILQSKL